MDKIGFGGSCHWCTEAIFQSLKGTGEVLQGWISVSGEPDLLSEAVIVEFDPAVISLNSLIEIHLHTHSCTSVHSMRDKYRSAVYCFTKEQFASAGTAIQALQKDFSQPIITEVLDFGDFKLNQPQYLNYYYTDTERPFCKNIVDPKLKELMSKFSDKLDSNKLSHLNP
ncbi:peptide-methionine (S)-S-oxide reductase [Pedobacter metabolipauper]|uniref:peptide-methionine (S)-S-oxide reductase n=1 Tax=Pedobacter metabolipauper TaxID=425513 RepID=A0A4R6STI3_9SPHI|nr:peptide-methionine (S)-S-oxide reductase [Pedobacter metabolipauper]TDQ08266.1 peptide-methionine (S)-S-oxide reductase [Pedobacter metabolipauper]